MFDNTSLNHTTVGLLIILGAVVIGRILKSLLNVLFKKLFARTTTTLDDRILDVIRARATIVTLLAGIYLGLLEIRKGIPGGDQTLHQLLDYANVILFIVAVFIITKLVSKIIQTTFEWYMDEISIKTHNDIRPTVAPLLTKVLNILLFLIAGMIVLDHFGVNIGSLLVSLGVGSLAIALAAQETVANMIAGFVILVDQPFRVGDRIRLTTGEEGDVYQIGLRSTRILNYDNNLVVVPNAEMVKTRIVNFSLPEKSIRILIDVNVAYGTDIPRARQILIRLAAAHPEILRDPAPLVFVMQFLEFAVQLRLAARTDSFEKKFDIETTLREQVHSTFRKEGITIPLPQQVIHMAQSDGSQGHQE
jgi:small-conductance mechanosensitive channel